MFKELIKDCYTVAVCGMSKNAGKTTVVNRLLGELQDEVVAISSVGYDGELVDRVTNTSKPQIFVNRGSYVLTAIGTISKCTFTKEVLLRTSFSSPLGDIVLLKALSSGTAEIAGPSIVSQMQELATYLKNLGCSKFIIDGALSRKSLGAVGLADGVILCSGASYSNSLITTVIDTSAVAKFIELKNPQKNAEIIELDILTDEKAQHLIKDKNYHNKTILLFDFTKIFISAKTFEMLSVCNINLSVKHQSKLIAITVNPFSAYGVSYHHQTFLDKMIEYNPNTKVFNVKIS